MQSLTSSHAALYLTVAFSVIVLINLLGNGLVCLTVLRFRGMRTPINYLLVNLAVSDIMVALSITPKYVIKWAFLHPNGTAGDCMCMLLTGGNFIWVGQTASTFSLVAIAVERYLAVCRPLGELPGKINTRRLIIVIMSSWIYAFLFDLPLFFVVRHKDGVDYCTERWSEHINLAKAYTITCFVVFGAIPLGAMVYLYVKVLLKLLKIGVRSTPLLAGKARIRDRQRVTKMLLAVSILYAVWRLPNLVLYMLSRFQPSLSAYGSVPYVTSVVLVGLNSAMNPFIYALHSTKFRRNIRLALRCGDYRPVDYTGARLR